MKEIKFDFEFAGEFAPEKNGASAELAEQAREAVRLMRSREGAGSDYLGWLDLPSAARAELDAIGQAAREMRERQLLVVVGIGGSYLGARAVIDALSPALQRDYPVLFAGHQIDAAYHLELLNHLKDRDYAVNIISKSGTTTEPGLAFRFLMGDLEKRFSADELKQRVFVTTDAKKGSLRGLADKMGLRSFVIPDDVGGRFSVFTPVGLLPIAAAGLDVRKLLEGARAMMEHLESSDDPGTNQALAYAIYRNACYRAGKKIEIMASYRGSLHYTAEWWKQLFGESEGKEGKGIFPASVDLTTDLHSMGQWMQEGERIIFETVVDVAKDASLEIPGRGDDGDGLEYLAGRSLHEVNRTALRATLKAHADGNVPCARLELSEVNEYTMGALLYMFEFACGVSAYMLGVNPFNQPGVEAYKSNMFRMLGKPGH